MIIDILCLGTLAIGFWMGYSRGIIRTAFSILSLFFGMLIAFMFSPTTTDLLEKVMGEGPLISLLGFVLTFVGIMLLVRMLAKGVEKLLEKIKLNILNKLAGGILLSMIAGVVFSVVLWFFDQAGVISSSAKSASMTYPILQDVPEEVRQILENLKPLFKSFWNDATEFIDQIRANRNS